MANLNSVGSPNVNTRVANEQAERTSPKRKVSLREQQGKVPSGYATGGRPQQAPRQTAQPQPAYQQAVPMYPQTPQPSPNMTQAGWATGANTGMRPARPDWGQTPLAPPPRPQNANYAGPQAPVQGGFTGGRPMMPQAPAMPLRQAQQPMPMPGAYPQPQYPQPGAWRQPMPQPRQAFANQYNPNPNWRRY